MTAILELAGLGKDYGDHTAVHTVDLRVEPAQIVGLLGPNGAGKTTTISMVAGVVQPTRGAARVRGRDVVRDAMSSRRALGLVPQELAIYEELNAVENLRFFGSLYGLRGDELGANVEWALEVAQLSDRGSEPVSRFSGGMKRRLNLAAGLVHKPELLLLDEPTVGVDPQSRAHIFDTVRALRDEGMSVLYTSHYMEEAQALCDRVAIMDAGRIVAEGRVDELITAHSAQQRQLVLHVEGSGDVAALRQAVLDAGFRIDELRASKGDLEGVFLALTGRALRDD